MYDHFFLPFVLKIRTLSSFDISLHGACKSSKIQSNVIDALSYVNFSENLFFLDIL